MRSSILQVVLDMNICVRREIDTQLKELRTVVESLETESHEEMMARLQQQQMQEQMEASEKPPPVASTPGAANKNSSVEKIYNQLETFRDSEMLHEQLVFRNKR